MRTHAHAHLAQRAHALLEDALEELLEDLWAKGSGAERTHSIYSAT
jgi:hypothetical protein